jgi:hypothetical protein
MEWIAGVAAAVAAVAPIVNKILSKMWEWLKKAWNKIAQGLKRAWNWFKGLFGGRREEPRAFVPIPTNIHEITRTLNVASMSDRPEAVTVEKVNRLAKAAQDLQAAFNDLQQ